MRMNPLIPFGLLIITVLGCNFARDKRSSPSADNKPNVQRSSRAKLIVQKEKSGAETGVYLHDLELRGPALLKGKPMPGKHRFEIGINAGYPGEKQACLPTRSALIILHEKPSRSGWQYPAQAKVVWNIDGQKTVPKKVIQQPIEKEDGEWWESLITEPDCETFRHLAGGQQAELSINDVLIKLSPEEIAELKRVANALGFQ